MQAGYTAGTIFGTVSIKLQRPPRCQGVRPTAPRAFHHAIPRSTVRLDPSSGSGGKALTIREPCFGKRAMFKEDKDMADQNEAKTKTIGFLPIEKVQTLNGWDEYADKSTKL